MARKCVRVREQGERKTGWRTREIFVTWAPCWECRRPVACYSNSGHSPANARGAYARTCCPLAPSHALPLERVCIAVLVHCCPLCACPFSSIINLFALQWRHVAQQTSSPYSFEGTACPILLKVCTYCTMTLLHLTELTVSWGSGVVEHFFVLVLASLFIFLLVMISSSS